MLVAPLLAVYEVGCMVSSESDRDLLRTGADAWLRHLLVGLGWTNPWILPLSVVSILAGWQILDKARRKVSASVVFAMILESLVLAVALVGVSRSVDMASVYLESTPVPLLSAKEQGRPPAHAVIVSFLGAGIYEEFLFRLILVPGFFYGLRLIRTPYVISSAVAVTFSGLLFSLAHHAGIPGEPFTWFAFSFRWFAGVAFAWIFVIRGFGIAVGTHTAYDILVGWFGWHF